MRRLSLAGLSLALGCLAASAWAEEIQWRPAGQPAATAPAAPGQPAFDPAVMRTSFNQGNATDVSFRSKGDEYKAAPLPTTPPPSADPVTIPIIDAQKPEPQKPEIMPVPKPLPSSGTPGVPTQGSVIVVPPGPNTIMNVPPGTVVLHEGMTFDGGLGGPDCCCGADSLLDPDWSCCGRHKTRCGSCCANGNCDASPFYVRGEYLLWKISRDHTPPLATSTNFSAAQLTALQALGVQNGAIGAPGTSILFEGAENTPSLSGGRFTIGFGDMLHTGVGLETTFFFLGQTGSRSTFASDTNGLPTLYSPFFNSRGAVSEAFAFPGMFQGIIDINHSTRMWGMEANLRGNLLCDCNHKLDILGGFRFIELAESLDINRTQICVLPQCAQQSLMVNDHFGTRNRFYGGQLGLDYEFHLSRWIFGATGKVAVGDMYQVVSASGATIVNGTSFAGVNPSNTGLLVQGTNSGRHLGDHFAVVPEFGFKVGYQITDNLSAYAGYSFMYMSNVVRPGEQIDLTIDPNGKLQRPRVPMNNTSFWAHGFNTGLEYKF